MFLKFPQPYPGIFVEAGSWQVSTAFFLDWASHDSEGGIGGTASCEVYFCSASYLSWLMLEEVVLPAVGGESDHKK